MGETPAPVERSLARLHVDAVPHAGRVTRAVVEAATSELGLSTAQATHLADAAAAVARAIHLRGFDDPNTSAVDVAVLRAGHRVIVRLDDLGLPFDYEDESELDGAALRNALDAGWVDEIHHQWRGRDGNRTELVRHVDPGIDLRDTKADKPIDEGAPPVSPDAEIDVSTRLATADDVDAITRLCWRTYGPTYQHDEYYQPERLSRMIEDGLQVSFITEVDREIVGHSAILLEEPGASVVEGGRAMVDPRYRGHRLMSRPRELREQWFAEHGVLAMAGAAVTAHTRSQRDGPILSVLLAFLPPIVFEGISGTDTQLREAVLGGMLPQAPIPEQEVHLPRRDAVMLQRLYELNRLPRTDVATGDEPPPPTSTPASRLDVSVQADLGHAVVSVLTIGDDLPSELRRRFASVRAGGISVVYVDLPLDDPSTPWAADIAADAGCILAGLLPLQRQGIDLVRYQHLGETRVDPAAIHIKSDLARELVDYVLAQRGADA